MLTVALCYLQVKTVELLSMQEYAKAVNVEGLEYPVYQMSFPGPSVHAKGAR